MLFDAVCVVCGQANGPVCAPCRGTLQPANDLTVAGLDRCRLGFALDDQSRPIIAAFKYERQHRIARWLANELVGLVPLAADAITWVPATPERRRSRGFDQAQELARALSRATGVPAVGLLRRHRSDERQTGRSRQERLAGPALQSLRTAPRFVVLVDDVVTTGSSMASAASVLRGAGAARIVGVAAAHTGSARDVCLRSVENATIIPQWT